MAPSASIYQGKKINPNKGTMAAMHTITPNFLSTKKINIIQNKSGFFRKSVFYKMGGMGK